MYIDPEWFTFFIQIYKYNERDILRFVTTISSNIFHSIIYILKATVKDQKFK
jgi:hypothetical protein